MKNPFHYIQEYPKRSKRLLGISHEQFLQLVRQAEIHEQQQQAQRERTKIRLNAKGGGRPPKLTFFRAGMFVFVLLEAFPHI
jgi:hypothetical protein